MTPTSAARLSVSAVVLVIALAGCVQPADPASVPPERELAAAAAAPRDVATLSPAAPDPAATLDAPPRLVAGEWWRIRFTTNLFAEDPPELLRVVADVQPVPGCDPAVEGESACGTYVVGMPHEAWYKEAIAFHAPGFGDVGFDLSYDLHDARFEPLRFPLVAGATWETTFAGGPLTATVERVEGTRATVRFEPPPSQPGPVESVAMALAPFEFDARMRLVYDAAVHEVVRFESMLGTWDVVEHGYGFEGWVTIPRGQDEAIVYGQFAGDGPVATRTMTVEGGYNRMTLMHAIVALSPGAYRIRATTPNGTDLVSEAIGEKGFLVRFHEAADPDGEWSLEDVVGGAGLTYSMGLAYHQYDIRLPDGVRRTDHSHAVIR